MRKLAAVVGISALLLTGVAVAKTFSYSGQGVDDPATKVTFDVKAKNAKVLDSGGAKIVGFTVPNALFNCASGQVRREPTWHFDEEEIGTSNEGRFEVEGERRDREGVLDRWRLSGRFKGNGDVVGWFRAEEELRTENCRTARRVRFEADR
jgi:hypothetical protein